MMLPMDRRPDRPAHGRLIENAREQIRPKLSQNAAGKAAGMSGNRWRQIVNGVMPSEGIQVTVRGAAETIARMAAAVGVTPEQLAGEGERPDAAEELRRIQQPAQVPEITEDVDELLDLDPKLREQFARLSPRQRARILDLYRETQEEHERLKHQRDERFRVMLQVLVDEVDSVRD